MRIPVEKKKSKVSSEASFRESFKESTKKNYVDEIVADESCVLGSETVPVEKKK